MLAITVPVTVIITGTILMRRNLRPMEAVQLAQGHRVLTNRTQIQTQFFLTQKPAKHLTALAYSRRPRNKQITLQETSAL